MSGVVIVWICRDLSCFLLENVCETREVVMCKGKVDSSVGQFNTCQKTPLFSLFVVNNFTKGLTNTKTKREISFVSSQNW